MPYLKRLIEKKLNKLAQHFPALLITGARQVGKSTLLGHQFPHVKHLTFDPIIDVYNAKADPDLFIQHLQTPIILDEIQFIPQVLSSIKRKIDGDKITGEFFLTGSQNFSMMHHVSETLAGRIAILTLQTLCIAEMAQKTNLWLNAFIKNPNAFFKNATGICFCTHLNKGIPLHEMLWRGFYPGLIEMPNDIIQDALESYFKTYIERDVRTLIDVNDVHTFSKFVMLLANLTAQEINYSELGRDINITAQTAKRWMDVLIACFQWTSVPAFSTNTIKRISQKPKGYLTDTGMACHLMRIGSSEALQAHPNLGALFETMVVQDILKQIPLLDERVAVYHWRAHSGAEIDLLLEVNNRYFPIEIKHKSNPTAKDARGIQAFKDAYPHLQIEMGLILAPVKTMYPVTPHCYAMPFDFLML